MMQWIAIGFIAGLLQWGLIYAVFFSGDSTHGLVGPLHEENVRAVIEGAKTEAPEESRPTSGVRVQRNVCIVGSMSDFDLSPRRNEPCISLPSSVGNITLSANSISGFKYISSSEEAF